MAKYNREDRQTNHAPPASKSRKIYLHLGRRIVLKKLKQKNMIVTTSTSLEGYKVVEQLGVVRGIIVRSRSLFGNIAGGLQTLFGGNITIYTELCERTRQDAFNLMIEHARQQNANAVINMRYDANEVMQGVTEVLAYGTAVVVEKIQ
jgi:uncharacterized protein YbjQ (UPF0145 family)